MSQSTYAAAARHAAAAASTSTSTTVQSVMDRVLAAIHSGGLRPGTVIREGDIANEFGLSRTPVREAFQLLREAGVLEVSGSRGTRIAVLSAEQTDQARRAWVPLHEAVLEEIIRTDRAPDPSALAELEATHAASVAAVMNFDNPRLAAANARLYAITVELADNPYLARAVGAVVHALRLGLMSMPSELSFPKLLQAQRLTIDAIIGRDRALAAEAVATLRGMVIPNG